MDLHKYLEQNELNKEDPDYQIEDFWYGLKKSMINFYKGCASLLLHEKCNKNIVQWSKELNKFKKDKEYSKIEEAIKEYITMYAIDVMENEDFNENFHSRILLTNIKRWNKISNKFHFGDSDKYKYINILFEAFCCIKKKAEIRLNPILELFENVNNLIISDFVELLTASLQLNQYKMIESIGGIMGQKKLFETLNEVYPKFLTNADKNTCGRKLCDRYIKYIESSH